MKYSQLTKEQFESLHKEFATFLATQQIDVAEWDYIKREKPKLAEEELNLFSDLVWEKVLSRANYLEHFSKKHLNLFKCNQKEIARIVVEVKKENFSFFNDDDYRWFINNTVDKDITFFKGRKPFTKERNIELFDLIKKGAVISDDKLYESIYKLIS